MLPPALTAAFENTIPFPFNVNDGEPLVNVMFPKIDPTEKLFVVSVCEPLPKPSQSPACGNMPPQFAAVIQFPSGAPPLVHEIEFDVTEIVVSGSASIKLN